jgi:hypothetical protein
LDNSVGWAVGQEGTIIYTEDGGNNWYPQISGTANHLESVFFLNADTGWVVGLNGTVRATQAGGIISQVKASDMKRISQSCILLQNYPNPFNPTTTIEFDLPRTSEVTLKIFTLLGEEVATLVSDRLSGGSYLYEWDANILSSGVYLYRLQAGDYVETRKMVLMK